jgi:hypothetical protein
MSVRFLETLQILAFVVQQVVAFVTNHFLKLNQHHNKLFYSFKGKHLNNAQPIE